MEAHETAREPRYLLRFARAEACEDAMFLYYALREDGPRVYVAREGILVLGRDEGHPDAPLVLVRARPPRAARLMLRRYLAAGTYRILAPRAYREPLLPVVDLLREEIIQIWRADRVPPPGRDAEIERFREGRVWGLRLRVRGEAVAEASVNWEGRRFAEVGVATLHPRFEGRGYATEIVRAAAAEILERGKVPLYCASEGHAASLRVGEKAGFRFTGKREIAWHCALG